ncbi:hypothetical protein YPPY72_2060 [Yersinia pestis PY-72]|nr:hypothetical protein YPPY72_2060 [Yersinia pestis PY-72]EIS96968.1 hypothetical protein YPPY89_2156 [Yersinia pestis PY-89]
MVCSVISIPTTDPSFSLKGQQPEIKSKLPATTPWEYGPIAAGAF